MLTVQYTGKGERTVGSQVVYPGELLNATSNLLTAWQAEHGDVFVVVRGDQPSPVEVTDTIVVKDDSANGTDSVAATPKAKRK